MGLLKKILGICSTKLPSDSNSWSIDENLLNLDLSRLPELNYEGGALRFEGQGLLKRVVVFRGEGENFHAFENRCTHMGRRLDLGNRPGLVKCCSVSGSLFDLSGKPVSGPAKKPVKTFLVENKDNFLIINLDS